MEQVLARNWWAFVIRGLLAIGFGLIAMFEPGITMLSLVLVFAAYAFVDGIFAIVAAVRAARKSERWGILVLEGVVNIIAGGLAVMLPKLTVVIFVLLMAGWALITGLLELAAAFKVETGRGWMLLAGLASVACGILLFTAPLIGALVLTWWIGIYALVFGVFMLILALRLRSRARGGLMPA